MPYLIGIQTSALCAREINGEVLTSCVVVHLDKDRVIVPMRWSYHQHTSCTSELTRLPSHAVNMLIDTINADGEVPHPRKNEKRAHPSTTTHKRTRILERQSRRRSLAKKSLDLDLQKHFIRLEEVSCNFSGGALGITFEEFKGPSAAPAIVKEFPKFASGRVGPAERSGVVKIGSLLVAINDVVVLGWSFRHTIRLLQQAPRPVMLRFWSPSDRENAAASTIRRIKSEASLSDDKPLSSDDVKRYEKSLSDDTTDSCQRRANRLLPWVDGVRASFAVLLTSLLHHVDSFVKVDRAEHRNNLGQNSQSINSQYPCTVNFDHQGFLSCSALSSHDFLQDFVHKQAFVEFINDLALEKVSARNDCYRRITLFKQLLHLFQEAEQPKLAITLLIERQFEMTESRSEDISIHSLGQ
uniref:AlNc14C11G1374 protein n=1 Tax=Albugo laibachii Nc14 TaxID=890382 RepID=F0W2Z5_9STRA|nr:AlNc14C11G1374 [Albugo laibachii Nc14]|eukprot:CCA15432.1 AlNc14C11G1374 [Albugo laibachii Nc14]